MKRRSRLHLRGLNQTLAYAAVMAAALAAVVLVSGRQFTILERPTGITLPAPTRIEGAMDGDDPAGLSRDGACR